MKILIPTDFTENSRAAYAYAVELANPHEAEFILMNSYESPKTSGGMLVSIDEVLKKDSKNGLARELEFFRSTYDTDAVKTVSRYGSVEDSIRRTNIEEGVDFVVMGTHGATGFKRVFMGSNTQRAISNLERPVFAVPYGYVFKPIERIALAIELKPIKNQAALEPLKYLIERFDAHLDVLHITDKDQDISLEDEIRRLNLGDWIFDKDFDLHVIQHEDVRDAVLVFQQTHRSDLTVFIPRPAAFFDRLFHRSTTAKFSHETRRPLLALKDI
ncbi:MAG TPA: hypothetical protein DDX92_09745 [Flavobacteriales bacterium]|jgi:nucleotide-binding universal stress UspA family protein|nr:hypothetical protein [Flavobacteriales bacterium]